MDRTTKAIILCFFALISIPVLVGMNQPEFDPQWFVNDATIIGQGGAQAAEEWQAEQDRLAAEAAAAQYYAPQSYYDPEYDSMTDQEYIAWRESGWNYDARNGRYIGKYQMDESRLNGDWSPEHQEEVAEQYMLDRYGSWEAAREFWDSNGWW